ncbi:MAG: methionyl-tRNA formyltransferase [Candidatus Sericytochromatia bacterium]|nr:methionyl-tRNA formyltransferase [Candidatus Sericytochromatia bacterium]
MSSRILFMGTPHFAVPTLEALHHQGYQIVGVVCQPDKPAGRGQKLAVPPVKQKAVELGIPIWQPEKLRNNDDFLREMEALKPDLGIVIAYGKLLPTSILDLPLHGCLNLHASLLPKYRGAAPIEWALIRGESETGVTLMQMDAGLDTGGMIAKTSCAIAPTDNAKTLADKLSALSAQLAVSTIPQWLAGKLVAEKQDDTQATLAPLLNKGNGQIPWRESALTIEHLIRGVCIRPGAHTHLRGTPVKLRTAQAMDTPCDETPGTILNLTKDGWAVATGDRVLLIKDIQLPGKAFQTTADVARGWRELKAGDRFTCETSPVCEEP